MTVCGSCGDAVVELYGRRVCSCQVTGKGGQVFSRYEYTPEEEEKVIKDCLDSFAEWEADFERWGRIVLPSRPYDVKREDQHHDY